MDCFYRVSAKCFRGNTGKDKVDARLRIIRQRCSKITTLFCGTRAELERWFAGRTQGVLDEVQHEHRAG